MFIIVTVIKRHLKIFDYTIKISIYGRTKSNCCLSLSNYKFGTVNYLVCNVKE